MAVQKKTKVNAAVMRMLAAKREAQSAVIDLRDMLNDFPDDTLKEIRDLVEGIMSRRKVTIEFENQIIDAEPYQEYDIVRDEKGDQNKIKSIKKYKDRTGRNLIVCKRVHEKQFPELWQR